MHALPQRTPAPAVEGGATNETYTVVHDRDGQPEFAVLALLDADGRRAWGRTTDPDDMTGLMEVEGCGRRVRVSADGRVDLR